LTKPFSNANTAAPTSNPSFLIFSHYQDEKNKSSKLVGKKKIIKAMNTDTVESA
jgi:hypothetical protein